MGGRLSKPRPGRFTLGNDPVPTGWLSWAVSRVQTIWTLPEFDPQNVQPVSKPRLIPMTIQSIINAYLDTEVKLQAFQPWCVFIVVWISHVYHNNANKLSVSTLYILRLQKTGQSSDILEHILCWRNVCCLYCYSKTRRGWMALKNSHI
jgi:hypothetical protein